MTLASSGEELVRLIKGILGMETVISNVNLPNRGQMPGMPMGAIVETNCVFTNGFVDPIVSRPLPPAALSLVRQNSDNIDQLSDAIGKRDMKNIFNVFLHQPLCSGLSVEQAKKLFSAMCENTRDYLEPYFEF